jgi:ABC-type branched-subunit amino acid transport system substrate-binding protein
MVQIYDATPVSPLAESENFFKTYLDYEKSCEEVSELLKARGYEKIGVLKMNLEHGDLCAKGIRNVFGDGAVVESYNAGMTDFRTSLAKLDASGAEVIFHAAFQPETLASLKNMRELGMHQPFVGLAETMTPGVAEEFKDVLPSAIMFGLPQASPELLARLNSVAKDSKVVDQNAAALAYLHITQLGEALSECKKETACVREKLAKSTPDKDVGFQGFTNRIAGFSTLIQEWKEGAFVPVQ